MKADKVISGNLVLEDRVVRGEVGIKDGVIVEIKDNGDSIQAREKLDFGECYVFPGFIDVHVHCFSNPDEGFTKVSRGAAVGGITSFLDMPYDLPNPINNVDEFQSKRRRLEQESHVDGGLIATIKKSGGLDQIQPLAEAGAAAFKMSLFETDPYRFPRIPDYEIYRAFQLIRETGLRVGFHAENDDLIYPLIEEHKKNNNTEPVAHSDSRPPVTESSAVLKLLEFAYWTRVKLHIFHVTLPRCIDYIQQFRKEGVDVTAETCYHYLLLDIEDLKEKGPLVKVNPPVRSKEDVVGLWHRLKTGEIEFVTSDHAPWLYDKKLEGEGDIFKSPSGLPGIEILAPLLYDAAVVSGKLTPVEFGKIMATNPAQTFNLHKKGSIAIGNDGDLTVVNPHKTHRINAQALQSIATWTPFDQQQLQGKIAATFVRGHLVYDGEKLTGVPGDGKFIPGLAYKTEREMIK
ncbi:dihydroorotase family protein [Thalassobacillus sp. CUG 92003]|uniref:dihydroorotase n=1 Tax=Thalassobacillus sp. CUG 92003 TaxID=2736641 RepID=UPI0015E7D2A9|nr:amidohydrolase family protein [Thalassobacillus sp. CUG 92003]